MINSVNGIQNQTVAIAAPVIMEAVGTTPRVEVRPTGGGVAMSGAGSIIVAAGAVMIFNLGIAAGRRYGVFPPVRRGITPGGTGMTT